MRVQSMHFFVLVSGILAGVCAMSGCSSKGESSPAAPEMVVPVVGFKARQQTVAEKISLVGTLEANEVVEIKSEIDGTVDDIGFEEGQMVKKGSPLFLIDQKKLQATLDQAQANLNLAETTLQRYETLIANGAISRQEYDQAKANAQINRAAVELGQAQLKEAMIEAPFDGVMGERMVSVGQFISKGTTLSALVSQDPMKAGFRIAERYLSQIKEGQTIEMRVAAYPQETFSGQVYFIDPQVDELTRTALLKARLANPEGKLRHGMFANLQLTVNLKENALVIPEAALVVKGDAVFVYAVSADNSVGLKPVKVGLRLPGLVEILEGLAAEETVVVEGYQKLAPGMKASVRLEEAVLSPEKILENPSATPAADSNSSREE